MTKVVIKDYFSGKILKEVKLNKKAQGHSLRYGPEWVGGNERFVIRDYFTNEKLQTCAKPAGSIEFWVE